MTKEEMPPQSQWVDLFLYTFDTLFNENYEHTVYVKLFFSLQEERLQMAASVQAHEKPNVREVSVIFVFFAMGFCLCRPAVCIMWY